MKKILKISLLCITLILLLCTSAIADTFTLTSEIPDEITIADAKTKPFSVSGTYAANAEISLQIKNTETGNVVLYQQSQSDENGAFTISGTMSDEVSVGTYELKLGATNLNTAKDFYFDTVAVTDKAEINIAVTGGSVQLSDGSEAPSTAYYDVGADLSLTAVADSADMVFLYWYDYQNKSILSTDVKLDVTVGSAATYAAVFTNVKDEIYITFKSNNKVLAAGLKGAVTIPADPYIAGYTFDGWYLGEQKADVSADVSENTVYTAGFKADTATYAVTIEGANQESGEYKYNDKVTVTPAGEEGKVFASWSRDGEVVSYSEEYSFYVSGKTTVVANYADSAVEKQIVLVMAQPVVVGANSDKIAFYAERNVPEGYSVIETGIILSQADSFTLTTSGVIKAKATSTANIGQYTVRKANVSAGDTWNAKAYLIYTDGTDIYTLYSNQVTKTL